MKRISAPILLLLFTLSLIAGCGTVPETVYQKESPAGAGSAAPKKLPKLKFGQLPIVDGLPFWVAEQKGYFKEQGVDVEFINFASANERDAAMIGGQVDGMLADLVASASLLGSGSKIQIASLSLGATQAEGPMAILAAPNSGITEVAQLKNQEIAVSLNSVMHFALEKMLLDAGLKPEEIKLISIPQIPLRFETLMSGKVKAAILPDPLFSLAAANGAKMLANDADAKQNYSQSVIVFAEKALTDPEKLEAVKELFVAYNRAVADIKGDPNGFKDLLVEKARLPQAIKEAYQVVPFSPAQAPKQEDVERVVAWLLEKKVLKAPVTYEALINSAALPR
jgi:NitT/TauT family transport system substrate-binding protein